MPQLATLPIDSVLPQLLEALKASPSVVLQADPGAGKTTRVPLACLDAAWLGNKRIIMLEPRRLAARNAARYMAGLLGEKVGARVGYRVRGENCSSKQTRIEVVTEGILTRFMQEDPELSDVGLVIFDEFHERNLQSDLGLALCVEIQKSLRADLRILIMSATLDGESIAKLLGGVPFLQSPGRVFPVQLNYVGDAENSPIDVRVADCVALSLKNDSGDILVFLPGMREIMRAKQKIEARLNQSKVIVLPLASELSAQDQDRALGVSEIGMRKVILSTSIAETSLTINGIRIVIDSGLMRVPRYDPTRGMSGLATIPVSQASADQRMGRAGREAPGACYRLWPESRQTSLPRFTSPEILNSDLAPFALELALWGTQDPKELTFLDAPPESSLAHAKQLLTRLGALDAKNVISAHGRALAKLGVHPRLGHMLLKAQELSLAGLACDLAALLSERDVIQGAQREVDVYSRWLVLNDFRQGSKSATGSFQLRSIERQAERLRSLVNASAPKDVDAYSIGILLALAYPDRIAKRRGSNSKRYLLSSGSGAELPLQSTLDREEYIVAAELDGELAHARIHLAERLGEVSLREVFRDQILEKVEVSWSSRDKKVLARKLELLGSLELSERPVEPNTEDLRQQFLRGVTELGLEALPWNEASQQFCARVSWLKSNSLTDDSYADLSNDALLANLPTWLGPFVDGFRKADDLVKLDLLSTLKACFTYVQLKEIDFLAPEALSLPSGTNAKLDYRSGPIPTLSVLLQEMFGQAQTPAIARGQVPVLVELLSPARRPLQVTKDLASFWKNAYRQVRGEMVGRYPKHYWPEDPLSAAPMRGAKRRKF